MVFWFWIGFVPYKLQIAKFCYIWCHKHSLERCYFELNISILFYFCKVWSLCSVISTKNVSFVVTYIFGCTSLPSCWLSRCWFCRDIHITGRGSRVWNAACGRHCSTHDCSLSASVCLYLCCSSSWPSDHLLHWSYSSRYVHCLCCIISSVAISSICVFALYTGSQCEKRLYLYVDQIKHTVLLFVGYNFVSCFEGS